MKPSQRILPAVLSLGIGAMGFIIVLIYGMVLGLADPLDMSSPAANEAKTQATREAGLVILAAWAYLGLGGIVAFGQWLDQKWAKPLAMILLVAQIGGVIWVTQHYGLLECIRPFWVFALLVDVVFFLTLSARSAGAPTS